MRTCLAITTLLPLAACSFTLNRALNPNEIRGRLVYESAGGQETPATNALVTLEESSVSVTSDPSGEFVIGGLTAGTYAITITTPGDAADGLRLQNLSLGVPGTQPDGLDLGTLVLGAYGSISGTVTLSGNAGPPDGAVVVLTGISQATVIGGKFTIGSVPPGDYQVVAFDQIDLGQTTASAPASIHVGPGAAVTGVTLTLSVTGEGSIAGIVQLAATGSIDSVIINPTAPGVVLPPIAPSDEEGTYEDPDIPPGIYTVTAMAAGFESVSVPFLVVAGQTTQVPTITLFSGASETDAGPTDAGPIDAGPIDAGPIDAGPIDAGPVDAGPVDAGPVDAGPVDAGPVDAGPVDAGPVDAGPIDAGPVDAGPVDAGETVIVDTYAGVLDGGLTNGAAETAEFHIPIDLALDTAGNLLVADSANCSIRKINATGTTVSTYAGIDGGCIDGAPFGTVTGVGVDDAGIVYVSDHDYSRVDQVAATGAITTLAGGHNPADYIGVINGPGGPMGSALFDSPYGLVPGADGNLFVVDAVYGIRRIDSNDDVWTLAGGIAGTSDGQGQAAGFNLPQWIAASLTGDLFVSDGDNSCIRKIDVNGLVSTYAGVCGPGSRYRAGHDGTFSRPGGIAVDESGYVYVSDVTANVIARVDDTRTITTLAGDGDAGFANGPGSTAHFNTPEGLAVNASGTVIYVADSSNNMIRRVRILDGPIETPDGGMIDDAGSDNGGGMDGGLWVVTVAGSGDGGFNNGPGMSATFEEPSGLAADDGGIYVSDNEAIRKIDGKQNVTTLVEPPDSGTWSGYGQLAADNRGTLYATDSAYAGVWQIKDIDTTPQSPVCLVGTCQGLNGQISGEITSVETAGSIATDHQGNLYVLDTTQLVVWEIEYPTSFPSRALYAGIMNNGGMVDGPKGTATFGSPRALAMDQVDDTLWVADFDDSGFGALRAVNPVGTITTVYHPVTSFTGITPIDVTVDLAGNVYFIEQSDVPSIERFEMATTAVPWVALMTDPSAIGFKDGEGGGRGPARVGRPTSLTVDWSGHVIFTDSSNNAVRELVVSPGGVGVPGSQAAP